MILNQECCLIYETGNEYLAEWHFCFSYYLMKLHLKYGFPISLNWHKSAFRQNDHIILTPALHVLVQASFLNAFQTIIFCSSCLNSDYFPKSVQLCVFINTYTNRSEGIVAGRKLWSEQHNTRNLPQPKGWVTTPCIMQPFLGCSTKVVKKISFVQKFGFQYQLSRAHGMKRQYLGSWPGS